MSIKFTKTAGIILLSIFLISCNAVDDVETSSGKMEGERIRGYVPAYNEMCLREPDSKLCNKE
jgi:hypothetical protein